jgi:transcription initiation factor IIE alpha subunit
MHLSKTVSLEEKSRWFLALTLLISLFVLAGCKQDAAKQASDSDANGYLCTKCGVKLYTERSSFLGPKCPKCGADTLVEVVAYSCPKDGHLTLTGRSGDRSVSACEKCGGPLSAMRLPRESNLKAWGAVRVPK